MKTNENRSLTWTRSRERGAALLIVIIFAFMAVASAALFLGRTHVELADGRLQSTSVRNLFSAHSALSRAHSVINESMNSVESLALNKNAALASPEISEGTAYITATNQTVRVRTDKPSDVFDSNGNEIIPMEGNELLPESWYALEARVFEPIFNKDRRFKKGALKIVRQYVRDGTPLSNNFLAVIADDLGLAGSPVNPGNPADGEIHTNQHMYLMTANPYYPNRLLAVDGVSYLAGATPENTVLLHPENNFEADPLSLPLPETLTSDPGFEGGSLKDNALGANPQNVSLSSEGGNYALVYNGVSGPADLRVSASDPVPSVKIDLGPTGTGSCTGICVEGNVDVQVFFNGDSSMIRLSKADDPGKYMELLAAPMPDNGVLFLDTLVAYGGSDRRVTIMGDVMTRTTLATTGNVDVGGSVKYLDFEGDVSTKMVYQSELEGVPPEDLGHVPEIPSNTIIGLSDEVTYFANERPYGVVPVMGDGFYDGDAVLGVVAAQDIILLADLPQNAEIAGAYLSLTGRMTLEGTGYDANGNLVWIDGTNDFYIANGGRSSIRRFGGLVSYRRPATAVVTWSGQYIYGFQRGFSLFDENMKQSPPPYFPKDRRPQYLGWELKDLGVKTIN